MKKTGVHSDLDNKTIALIEQVAAEVRASIEGGISVCRCSI